MPTSARLAAAAIVLLISAATAFGQDPKQLAAEGGRLLTANRFPEALAQFLSIPDSAPDAERFARHIGAVHALTNMARANEAAVHLEHARALLQVIDTDASRVRFLNAEGFFLNTARRGDRGLASLHEAAAIAERAGAKPALATVYSTLGSVYQRLDDWERATYYAQKEFDLLENPSAAERLEYHISRGIAFFEMYERDPAEAEFLRARELSAASGRVRDRAFAQGELAFLYWTFDRDAGRALPLYDEAIRLATEAKALTMTANWITNRANVLRDIGDYAGAEAGYHEALRIFESGGLENTAFHVYKNIAQVWRLQGRTAAAVEALEKLLAERRATANMRHIWQAHMELASAYDTLGQRDRAEANFRAMLDVLEEHRTTAILDAFRTGTLAHQLSLYDPYERYIRFLTSASPPRAEAALDIAERARARGFLESLASVRGAVARRLPAALLAEESRIRRAISGVQEQLRAARLTKAQRDRLVGELERAEQEREKFLLTLRVEHPSLAEARYPTLLDTAAVQAALRPGEIAITYFLAEPNSFRWVLSRDQVRVELIAGRSAIEQAATRLRDLLRAPTGGGEVTAAATRLGALLLDRIAAADERPLIVVPHGALHYVPFEVLPLHGKLLIERHPVAYAPSLNALVQLRRVPANPAPFRVLAVGDPATTGAPATDRGVENLAWLAPLAFAEQELHAIGRTFPDRTRILSGASARESGLRTAGLSQYPVLHFATHGLVSDVQPKRSGLLLAPEAGEDGLLQMGEIYGLGLKADLVVLSACQTALGREITGEGMIGLSRAFFYAGARAVVATLWNLNDRFASEFVQRFYREVNAGHSSQEALRRAKLAYISHPRYSHPFYWASLVLLGDGTPALVDEPVRARITLNVMAAAFTIAALGIALSRRG